MILNVRCPFPLGSWRDWGDRGGKCWRYDQFLATENGPFLCFTILPHILYLSGCQVLYSVVVCLVLSVLVRTLLHAQICHTLWMCTHWSLLLLYRSHPWMWCGAMEQRFYAAQRRALQCNDGLSLGTPGLCRFPRPLSLLIILTLLLTIKTFKKSFFKKNDIVLPIRLPRSNTTSTPPKGQPHLTVSVLVELIQVHTDSLDFNICHVDNIEKAAQ